MAISETFTSANPTVRLPNPFRFDGKGNVNGFVAIIDYDLLNAAGVRSKQRALEVDVWPDLSVAQREVLAGIYKMCLARTAVYKA